MSTFKTLDELHEYNNQNFEHVFGKIKSSNPENPFRENSWDALQFNARPHDVFKLDWSNYSSIDFANTFLPYIKNTYEAKASYIFDGAELFKNFRKAKQELLPLTTSGKLINVISYTYPKGVVASQGKDKILAAKHEILLFFEVDKFGAVDLSFKFGENFKSYLKSIELKLEESNNKDKSSVV